MTTTEQMHQRDLERLGSLRYMDDDFMTVCLADNFEGVELILRIVLGRKDITIKSVRTQEPMKNLQGRSAVLDVHAVDSSNKEFDIEIQRKDAGACAKRARHNSSLLDAHILYVNGKYRGNDEIGKLMYDFSCTDPEDMNFEALAKKARYYKQDEKGVAAMCKMMEDMRSEAAKEAALDTARETARRMMKDGEISLEKIARYLPLLSMDELKKLESEVIQLA